MQNSFGRSKELLENALAEKQFRKTRKLPKKSFRRRYQELQNGTLLSQMLTFLSPEALATSTIAMQVYQGTGMPQKVLATSQLFPECTY